MFDYRNLLLQPLIPPHTVIMHELIMHNILQVTLRRLKLTTCVMPLVAPNRNKQDPTGMPLVALF